jgi:hypothetical protein
MCETTDRLERTPALMRQLFEIAVACLRIEKHACDILKALGHEEGGNAQPVRHA